MTARSVLLRVSPWGGGEVHGGQLRSQQIASLVCRALPDAKQIVAGHPRALRKPALAAMLARGVITAATARVPLPEGFFTAWVEAQLAGAGLGNGDLVIYDADPRYGPALMRVARRRGLRVVALPHNVEALIPKRWPIKIDPATTARALAEEVRWLADVDAVWAIGRIDCDLFQLLGINARLLPYVPSAPRSQELLEIRASRAAGAPQTHILVLGTAHNPPTRAGMIEQLSLARQLGDVLPLPVVLAGYGTDAIGLAPPPGVRLVGAQDWPALKQLITGAAAMWVHQAPMSGALTRIPEALFAGVPVVANAWAARGHAAMPGMAIYEDASALGRLLAAPPRDFPAPDFSAVEAEFCTFLRALVK